MIKTETDKFRSRWRRWLGNKTRFDQPCWTTLLDSRWVGWAEKVFSDAGLDWEVLGFTADREKVKEVFSRAIDNADMDALKRLDGLYCAEKLGL